MFDSYFRPLRDFLDGVTGINNSLEVQYTVYSNCLRLWHCMFFFSSFLPRILQCNISHVHILYIPMQYTFS